MAVASCRGLKSRGPGGDEKNAVIKDAHRPRVEVWSDVVPWTAPVPAIPEDPMGMWRAPVRGLTWPVPKESWVTPPDAAAARDAAHFLDCLEQGRESRVPAKLAASATEILLAAYRSAATGENVPHCRFRSEFDFLAQQQRDKIEIERCQSWLVLPDESPHFRLKTACRKQPITYLFALWSHRHGYNNPTQYRGCHLGTDYSSRRTDVS